MIRVVEGPNGAGKTTLIYCAMKEGEPVRVIHNSMSLLPMTDYVNQAFDAMKRDAIGVSTFIDRYNIGEQVYPVIYGRRRKITPDRDRTLVEILGRSFGVRWTILCPPIERLILAHYVRDEDFDVQTLLDERNRFIAYYEELPSELAQYFTLVTEDTSAANLVPLFRKD